jgi:regulator of sigma E protease
VDFLWFVVVVSVLVLVHELGHLVAAKVFGVRVLTFSLGLGPRLWGITAGGTEYRIALVPLGGYVRMLGEGADDAQAAASSANPSPASFRSKPVLQRLVIVLAGPLMSISLPFFIFVGVTFGVAEIPAPVVGTVFPGRPAHGHVLPGDRVVSVEGRAIHSFEDVTHLVEGSPGKPLAFVVERDGARVAETRITPVATLVRGPLDLVDSVGRVGIMPHQPGAIVGVTDPVGPAAQAGIETFDRIVRVGSVSVDRFLDLERALAANRGSLAPTTYFRPVPAARVLGGWADMEFYEPHVAALSPRPAAGNTLARAGFELADAYVRDVRKGSVAEAAGLLARDRILAVDGRDVAMWSTVLEYLAEAPGGVHELRVRRRGEEVTLRVDGSKERARYDGAGFPLGATNWMPMRIPEYTTPRFRVVYALTEASRRTWGLVKLTVVSLLRLFQGRVPLDTIGGPLSILEAAGTAARDGTSSFLLVLAFVSVNLGVINLLPIPMLDGGQAVLEVARAIRRKPLSVGVERGLSIVGFVLLLAMMALAIKNDVVRLFGSDDSNAGAPHE